MGAAGRNVRPRSRIRRGGGATIVVAAVVLVAAGVVWFLVYRSGQTRKETRRRGRHEAARAAKPVETGPPVAETKKAETQDAEVVPEARERKTRPEPDVEIAAPDRPPGERVPAEETAAEATERPRPAPRPEPAKAPVETAPIHVTTVHVSTEGDDANPGTKERPLRTIAEALAVVAESGTVRIAAGTYREGGLTLKRGGKPGEPLVIEGEGADRTFIKGSREVKGWERSKGNIWKVDGWKTNSQQLFCDGEHLQQIGSRTPWNTKVLWADRVCLPPVGQAARDIRPGSFYHDGRTNTLYCMLADRSDPNGHLMEASVHDFVLDAGGASCVTVRGLAVMHNNGTARGRHSTLFRLGSSGWTVEDCLIEYGDFAGLGVGGTNHVIRRSTIRKNGDVGINMGNSDRARGWKWYPNATRMNILIEDCVIEGNNYRNFYAAWHAGGMKCIPACRAVTVRGCTVRDNDGPGIWFDHAQGDIVIEDNLVVGNKTGIFYEISSPAEGDEYGALIRNNRVVGSAHQGIYVSASECAIVERNTCYDNWAGIVVHGMPRGKFRLRNNVVRNNIVCRGKLADLILFVGQDAGDNIVDGNFYATGDLRRYGLGVRTDVRIGAVTGKGYAAPLRDPKQLGRPAGLEHNGLSGDPMWVDPAKLDFRLLRGSPAVGKGWTMKAER